MRFFKSIDDIKTSEAILIVVVSSLVITGLIVGLMYLFDYVPCENIIWW